MDRALDPVASTQSLPPILVVEDDQIAVAVIRRSIEMAGLTNPIVALSDGLDARYYITGEGPYADRAAYPPPVVVILDVQIPTINGLDLLATIKHRRETASIPVVILSASGLAEEIDRAHALGARTFLVKPVGFEALRDVVESLRGRWAILEAKAGNGGTQRRSSPAIGATRTRTRAAPGQKRRALASGLHISVDDLEVHFQPIVDLATRRTRSVEALARLRMPDGRLIQPDDFIPEAEQSGDIVEIGARVLWVACEQLRRWRESVQGTGDVSVSVNLSPVQLRHPRLIPDVLMTLDEMGLSPESLVLEVTESVLIDGGAGAIGKLRMLHDVGVKIAIDDFGTGYSSIAYLQSLPVDSAKIDKSLTKGIGDEPERWALVRAIAELIAAAGLVVVAEGIERPNQLAHLRALGCELGQGFHFAEPAEGSSARAFFNHRPLPLGVGTG